MPDADVIRASLLVNGQVLEDEVALRASIVDLEREVRDEATRTGRWVVNRSVKVEGTRQKPVSWWQAFRGKTPPRLYRLVVVARTAPLDDELV